MKSIVMAIAILMPLVFTAPQSFAQTAPIPSEDAEAFVGALAERALDTLALQTISLEQREKEFRDILRHGFALKYIGLLVLGNHRRQATPEQLQEYQIYFSEFILKKYSTLLGGYAGETFVVLSSRPSGKRDVLVRSEIQRSAGAPIPTEWRVRKFNTSLKVIDIKVEGISMVQSQREEFGAILAREGVSGLIAVLRARTGMMSAEAPA
jgi:phospholipid transport system substrate-binding protein